MLTRVFGWGGPSQRRDGGAIPAWQPPERCDLTLEPLGCRHAAHVLWCEEQPRERSFAAANDEVFCEQAARVRGGSGAYSDTDVYWLFNRSSPCVDKWDFCARENATKCPRARAWFENHRFSLSMQRPWQCALDEEEDPEMEQSREEEIKKSRKHRKFENFRDWFFLFLPSWL